MKLSDILILLVRENLGVPLKRIQFKWRMNQSINQDDIIIKRNSFWETCYSAGVSTFEVK